MAVTIDASDYKIVRQKIYQGASKTELKSLAHLPTKSELQDAIEYCMNLLDSNKATIKSNIDSRLGLTTSALLASLIFRYSVERYLERYN